jgi:endoglucanase
LPDSLPAVPPTIIAAGTANQPIYPGNYTYWYPFQNVTIIDTNSGTPTDSVTITLSGSAGTLSGLGISGTGPYTIAAASAASVTATLQAAAFTTANTIGNTTTFSIHVISSAGTNSTNATPSTIVTAYVAETPFSAPVGTFTPVNMFGVNLSGGENTGLGTLGLPQTFEINYFAGKGFGLIRMPVTSASYYTTAFGLLNHTYITAMKSSIDAAFAANMYIIIDPHDYGGVWNSTVGATQTILPNTVAQNLFEDEWVRLMTLFKHYPNVIFGLMNEPVGMSVSQWFTSASACITTARNTSGATQLLTIPGGANFTGAHDWVTSGNAAAWAGYNGDPANNFIFEMHQYLDSSNSGESPVAVVGKGSTVLVAATGWLVTNGFKAFLGEFGMAWDPWYPQNTGANINNYDPSRAITLTTNSITENQAMLAYMQSNSTQWVAWAEWAGGINFAAPIQNGGYCFNPEPVRTGSGYVMPIVDQPQIAAMTPYI